jgi:hypothetical protein
LHLHIHQNDVFYPLSEFDGKIKTTDWSKLSDVPAPPSSGKGETQWVNPDTFFDEFSQGRQLDGQNTYAITLAKGQVPPVKGFWSLTLYDEFHFFHPNPLNRYSLDPQI